MTDSKLTLDEIAEILCSPKSTFQTTAQQAFSQMVQTGLTRPEIIKFIKIFYRKSNTLLDPYSQLHILNIYNLQGVNSITWILVSCILALYEVNVVNYMCGTDNLALLPTNLTTALTMLKQYKICFIDTNSIHPCLSKIESGSDPKILLLKTLITISGSEQCIFYTSNKRTLHLVVAICQALKILKFMVLSKTQQPHVLYQYTYQSGSIQTTTLNTLDYHCKLAPQVSLDTQESSSLLKALALGYRTEHRNEIILITALILFFTNKVLNLQEGINIVQTIFTSEKLLPLLHQIGIV